MDIVRYGLTGLSFGIEVTTPRAGEGVVPRPAVAPPPVSRDLTDMTNWHIWNDCKVICQISWFNVEGREENEPEK